MTPIDILPCVIEDGNVRRPNSGRPPSSMGPTQKMQTDFQNILLISTA